MDDLSRKRWIAAYILPLEGQARRWLTRRVRSLSASDIDDLIQESYYRIWTTADLSAIQTPGAYLFVILRNLLFQQSRHAKVVPMERMGEIDELSIPSEEPGPDRRLSARQELDRVTVIVESLPQQCRKVFELRKVQGLSQRSSGSATRASSRKSCPCRVPSPAMRSSWVSISSSRASTQ
jgi:RNA polymerase sigma-70 factor (ECF subfamily)